MAVVYTDPFEPITTLETDDRSPCSTRALRALVRNANNLKAYVCNPKIIPGQHWQGGILSANASTTETTVAAWPRLPAPRGFLTIRFVLGAVRTAGAGTTTFQLYSDSIPWVGVLTDSSFYRVGSVAVASATFAHYETTLGLIREERSDTTWMRLTAQNSNLTTRARALHLDAWLEI